MSINMSLQIPKDANEASLVLTSISSNNRTWESLADLRQQNVLCDLLFITRDGQVQAHSCVLMAASTYLNEVLMAELETFHQRRQVFIEVPSVGNDVLNSALNFIYTGSCDINVKDVNELKHAAEYLRLPELIQLCANVEQNITPVDLMDTNLELPSRERDQGIEVTGDIDSFETEGEINDEEIEEEEAMKEEEVEVMKEEEVFNEEEVMDEQEDVMEEHEDEVVVAGELKEELIEPEVINVLQEAFYVAHYSTDEVDQTLEIRDPKPVNVYLSEFAYSHIVGEETVIEVASQQNSTDVQQMLHMTDSDCPEMKTELVLTNDMSDSSPENKLHCHVCSKVFETRYMLLRHAAVHSDSRPWECELCGIRFKLKNSLVAHRVRHGEKTFQCLVCTQTFYTNADLDTHFRSHTGNKPFVCSVCGKAFSQKGNMLTHKVNVHRVHRGNAYKCSECPRTFLLKRDMDRHINTHTRRVHCPVCNATFRKGINLNKHLRHEHSVENAGQVVKASLGQDSCSYQCPACSYAFDTEAKLTNHVLKVHQKVKRYQCGVEGCSYQAFYQCQILAHEKTHSKWQPSPLPAGIPNTPVVTPRIRTSGQRICPACGKMFPTKAGLAKHEKNVHYIGPQHEDNKCTVCGGEFPNKGELRAHLAKEHNQKVKRFTCHFPRCEFQSYFRSELNSHQKSHDKWEPDDLPENLDELPSTSAPVMSQQASSKDPEDNTSCQECSQKFNSNRGLQIHRRKMHNKSEDKGVSQCPECSAIFKHPGMMRKHIACIHRRQKRFECTECHYKSYFLSEMKIHWGKKHAVVELPDDVAFVLDSRRMASEMTVDDNCYENSSQ